MLSEQPQERDKALYSISEKATSLARKIYRGYDFPLITKQLHPVDWADYAVNLGISKADAVMIILNVAKIPYKNTNEISNSGVWAPKGVYVPGDGVFYSRQLTRKHFESANNGIKIGMLMGDLPASSYLAEADQELEDSKDLIREIYTSIMFLSKPTCEFTHFSLTGHYLAALCGTRDVLYRRLDEGFTPLLELSQKRAVESIGDELWKEPIKSYINYIKLNPARKFSFFLGDMIEDVFNTLKNLTENTSIFKVINEIPAKKEPNAVCVIDFDNINSLSDNELSVLSSVNTLFFSREKSLPRLYGKMRRIVGRETLSNHFGVYAVRVLGTKVCQSCCGNSEVSTQLTDNIYGFSYNVKRPPIVGPGCSSCVGGYEGSYLLKEDSFLPGVAGAIVHSFEKDQDNNLRSLLQDQFKLSDAIMNSQKIDTLLGQLEEAVTGGLMTVEDSGNLIN